MTSTADSKDDNTCHSVCDVQLLIQWTIIPAVLCVTSTADSKDDNTCHSVCDVQLLIQRTIIPAVLCVTFTAAVMDNTSTADSMNNDTCHSVSWTILTLYQIPCGHAWTQCHQDSLGRRFPIVISIIVFLPLEIFNNKNYNY